MLAAQCERLAEFIKRALLIHFRPSLVWLRLYTRVPDVTRSVHYFRNIRPSVRPYAFISTAATGRIYVIFDTGDFLKICLEFPNLFTMGHKYPALDMKIQLRFIVASDINSAPPPANSRGGGGVVWGGGGPWG
jgi:hypothetical protein